MGQQVYGAAEDAGRYTGVILSTVSVNETRDSGKKTASVVTYTVRSSLELLRESLCYHIH